MDITRVVYGKSELAEADVLPGGSEEALWPIDFAVFLLRSEGVKLLVDSGCETMPGFVMRDFIGPVEALARLGVQAREITHLIITHAHHDHAAAAAKFPNAHIYIHALEYEKAKKYFLPTQQVTLVEDSLSPLPGVTIRHMGGHSPGSCVVEVGRTVLCGDECYARINLQKKLPTASSCCPERSQRFIDHYAQGWQTLLCHEP